MHVYRRPFDYHVGRGFHPALFAVKVEGGIYRKKRYILPDGWEYDNEREALEALLALRTETRTQVRKLEKKAVQKAKKAEKRPLVEGDGLLADIPRPTPPALVVDNNRLDALRETLRETELLIITLRRERENDAIIILLMSA